MRAINAAGIRRKLLADEWYEVDFPNNSVVALNPFYQEFSLGLTERWLNAGWLAEAGRWLYVYPLRDTLEGILAKAGRHPANVREEEQR